MCKSFLKAYLQSHTETHKWQVFHPGSSMCKVSSRLVVFSVCAITVWLCGGLSGRGRAWKQQPGDHEKGNPKLLVHMWQQIPHCPLLWSVSFVYSGALLLVFICQTPGWIRVSRAPPAAHLMDLLQAAGQDDRAEAEGGNKLLERMKDNWSSPWSTLKPPYAFKHLHSLQNVIELII